MDRLDELESRSIYVIREAYKEYGNIATLWSIGKDSTTVAWLVRKAFYGKVPFPFIHIDTTFKFPEMYEFRKKYAEEWGIELLIAKNDEALSGGMGPDKGKFECCNALKTEALKKFIDEKGFKALLLGIRRDEHGVRSKERYFSPRDKNFKWNYREQPPELWDQFTVKKDDATHIRVHPILHWSELDIWEYIKRENIPVNELYFAKNGKRYRSLGCYPCTKPIDSNASTVDEIVEELKTTKVGERSGRAQDKEQAYMMQKLRVLGYM